MPTLLDLFSLGSTTEDDVLGLVPVEPTHGPIVHLEVKLSALMTDANGVEHGSATFNILQIDESSYCHSLPGFGLEGISVEEDIPTVGVGSISTLVLRCRKVHDDSTILHVAVVGVARGVFYHVSFGTVELYVSNQTLCCWRKPLWSYRILLACAKILTGTTLD